jgi:hypothetical protein
MIAGSVTKVRRSRSTRAANGVLSRFVMFVAARASIGWNNPDSNIVLSHRSKTEPRTLVRGFAPQAGSYRAYHRSLHLDDLDPVRAIAGRIAIGLARPHPRFPAQIAEAKVRSAHLAICYSKIADLKLFSSVGFTLPAMPLQARHMEIARNEPIDVIVNLRLLWTT